MCVIVGGSGKTDCGSEGMRIAAVTSSIYPPLYCSVICVIVGGSGEIDCGSEGMRIAADTSSIYPPLC